MENLKNTDYELIVGLEIHLQLVTKSKAYCSDNYVYGEEANTQVSPISLGHPGTLPVPNYEVINQAIRLGIATNSAIREVNEYARKNYFYADMPKGYQITQDQTPICTEGFLEVNNAEGKPVRIGITRIHMEEDSGKSIHDIDPFDTLVDLNRAGVPLLEVVSEPDIRSVEEAYNYLAEVRKIVRYLDVCDGNMEEGSMRCDANISVRKKGEQGFRNRVEVKNMNSLRNVQRAILVEANRQIDVYENGGQIDQETHSYDANTNSTFVMRSKEDAHDYRYFPEPDIIPVIVTEEKIAEIQKTMPTLPSVLFERYVTELKLSDYDATLLTEDRDTALFFEEIIKETANYKSACNYLMGSVKSYLNEKTLSINEFPVSAKKIAEVVNLIDEGKFSHSAVAQTLFPALIKSPNEEVIKLAESLNIIQDSDEGSLKELIETVLENMPDEVERFKNGEKRLQGLFMGQIMKASKGKADPKLTSKLLNQILS
ncbi:MAG: Asp-tRNA(Asn)/Glu-tRNA(Gln) amidotransferase subunit GatB [Flavobacteriales bacterium]